MNVQSQERPPEQQADKSASSEPLLTRYNAPGGLAGQELLDEMINREFKDRIAVVSSFGAESTVLLHMVAAFT